jgi:hypothetical protein
MHLPDQIPTKLVSATDAALLWVNNQRSTNYELTGVVDVDEDVNIAEPFELGLILCDGEICIREQVCVTGSGDAYQFDFVEQAPPAIPPLLDPPQGVRKGWLEAQLQKYEFVLLLYYRGLW